MTIRKLWGDDDIRNSEIFLRTGQYNEVVRNAPEGTTEGDSDFSKLNACTSSSQCPAGYACVGGVCTKISFSISGGSGQYNSAGSCNQDSPYPNDPCNSGGPSSCSTTPTCENNPKNPLPEECCGKRCCSYGSLSSSTPGVNCYCGDCPDRFIKKKCSIFCSGAGAALGDPGTMGCNESNSCDICKECDFFSRQCEQKENGPCFCEGNECDQCATCDTNANSADFGLCQFLAGVCSNCVTCPELKCPCGESFAPTTYCNKVGPGGSGSPTGSAILVPDIASVCSSRQCKPITDPTCDDKCKGVCEYKTYCDDTTGPAPACPPNTNCTSVGSLSTGGTNCTIREECDVSNLPPECKECDCNCNNDCPPCQLCGADGKCYDDPACVGQKRIKVYRMSEGTTVYSGVAGFECGPPPTDQLSFTSGPINADVVVTISNTSSGSTSWTVNPTLAAQCPGLGQTCNRPIYYGELFFDGASAKTFEEDGCLSFNFGDGVRYTTASYTWRFEEEYI